MRFLLAMHSLRLALLALLFAAPTAEAQVRPAPSNVAARLRSDGNNWEALQILKQAWGPHAPSELDAVADTLVAIAVTMASRVHSDPADVRARKLQAASSAVETLRLAGIGPGAARYIGSPPRLLRIAESGAWTAPAALLALTSQPDTNQTLRFLRQISMQDTYAAPTAVFLLAADMGVEGIDTLRGLYRAGLVVHPLARRQLDAIAAQNRW